MLERHPAITNAKTNHWNITPIFSFRNIEMACTFTVSTTPTRELRPNSTKLISAAILPNNAKDTAERRSERTSSRRRLPSKSRRKESEDQSVCR